MQRRRRRRTELSVLAIAVAAAGLFSLAAPGIAEAAAIGGIVETGGVALNVRDAPSSSGNKLGTVPNGSRVDIVCYVAGQQIAGSVRTTTSWDKLSTGGWVSDAYIRRTTIGTKCAAPATPTVTAAVSESWLLPIPASPGSGFRTANRPTHDGVDLPAARNTTIKAAANGTVIRVRCNTDSNNCDVDGHIGAGGCGWYAEIQHAGNVVTRYCHMIRQPSVTVGQAVKSGQIIGYVGTSGNSSGPHLHFEVHVNAVPVNHENAVDPVAFLRTRGLNIS